MALAWKCCYAKQSQPMKSSRCNLASFVQSQMRSLERVWILRKLPWCNFRFTKILWSKMKQFCVKGHFCGDLRVICPKSASSSNRLYPGGQWINVPWNTGSRRSLHTTVISRRQDSRPITPPGFTAFWLESIKCKWGGGSGAKVLWLSSGRGSLSNARQYTHGERLPACWLLFADCCMCSTRNISQTDNREKNGPDGDLQFFLFFFFSSRCHVV